MELRTADHSAYLQEVRTAVPRRGQRRAEEALTATLEGVPVQRAHRLRQETNIWAWMTVQPSTVNGTELGAQEWRDALFLGYGLDTPDLPTHCDGCHTKLTIIHTLDCKRGVLVTARLNDIRNGISDLARKDFTPSHVHEDPLIYSGHTVKRTKATSAGASDKTDQAGAPPLEVTEQKGNLLIRDLWQIGTDIVQNMRVVNTDDKSHMAKDP